MIGTHLNKLCIQYGLPCIPANLLNDVGLTGHWNHIYRKFGYIVIYMVCIPRHAVQEMEGERVIVLVILSEYGGYTLFTMMTHLLQEK